MHIRITTSFSIAVAYILLILGCNNSNTKDKLHQSSHDKRDFAEIKQKGTLVLLTENTSFSYFIYKGNPIGYDYEMVKRFCDNHNLALDVKIIDDFNEVFNDLNQKKGDLVAYNLAITPERKKQVKFTNPLFQTHQVLIQRVEKDKNKLEIQSIEDLAGKSIWVHKYSSFYEQLINLEKKFNIDIDIREADGNINTEQLIRQVAQKKIDYTVADENYAKLNKTYYNNIDYGLILSKPQQIAWAVRNSSDSLLQELNLWLSSKKHRKDNLYLQKKYFTFIISHKRKVTSPYSSLSGQKISIYDPIIKREAKKLDWDWRLLAALINKESGFNPDLTSWAGAFGLMQLLPEIAIKYGIDTTQTEEANIIAGVKYLKYLDKYWSKRIENKKERINFVLASYNAGIGHIVDARILTKLIDKNPVLWKDNVAEGLKLKTQKKYYRLPEIKNGYCRGYQVIRYVQDILETAKSYKLIKEK